MLVCMVLAYTVSPAGDTVNACVTRTREVTAPCPM